MKLAGICCCDSQTIQPEKQSCCDEMAKAAGNTHSSKCPLNSDQKKSCCAYTPANGLTADAQPPALIDAHQDCLANAFSALLQSVVAHAALPPLAPRGLDSPQPYDTPLYLRAHSFLI